MNFNFGQLRDSKVRDIVSSLNDAMPKLAEIGGRAYLVGGFVRDYLIGKQSDDVDVEVVFPRADKKDSIDKDVALFLIRAAKIIADNVQYWIVDEDQTREQGKKVYARVWFPLHSNLAGIKSEDDLPDFEQLGEIEGLSNQGTITLTGRRQDGKELSDEDKLHLDVALARTEAYSLSSRKPEVKPATFSQDAHRRDFTINTMAVDLFTNQIVDPTGKGINDLLHRFVLRTPLNPYQIFLDDPLRILRAIRMKNRFRKPDGTPFDLHPDIESVFNDPEKMKVLLSRFGEGEKVSMERIQEEIGKMMKVSGFGGALDDLKRLGILDTADIQFGKLLNKKIIKALDNAQDDLDEAGKLAVWFHNFEEEIQNQIDKKELKKKIRVEDVLRKLKYKNEIVDEVKRLLSVLHVSDKQFGEEVTDDKVRRMIRDLTKDFSRIQDLESAAKSAMETYNRFIALTKAVGYKGYDALKQRVQELGGLEDIRSGVDKSIISGYDIINWGVKPGPQIKDVENQIEELVKILKPQTETGQQINEQYIKDKLNDPSGWKIVGGKIVDINGVPVVEKYRRAITACRSSLIKIANKLERAGYYEMATEVDKLIKVALGKSLMKQISEFSKRGEAYSEKEELGRNIDQLVQGNMNEVLNMIPELKEIMFDESGHPIGHGTPYHKEDIFSHTLGVCKSLGIENIKNVKHKVVLLLSGLLHDIGKPTVKAWLDREGTGVTEKGKTGLYQYLNHAKHSREIAKDLLNKYGITGPIADMVELLCGYHIKFHDAKDDYLESGKVPVKSLKKLFGDFDDPEEGAYLLGVLSKADISGTQPDEQNILDMGGSLRKREHGHDIGQKIYSTYKRQEKDIEDRRLEKIRQEQTPLGPDQRLAIITHLIEDKHEDPEWANAIMEPLGLTKSTLFRMLNDAGRQDLINGIVKLRIF